jgi:hypothetical protein
VLVPVVWALLLFPPRPRPLLRHLLVETSPERSLLGVVCGCHVTVGMLLFVVSVTVKYGALILVLRNVA